MRTEPLGLVLTTDADPVQTGGDLEYVLRFGNRGDDALLNAQLALTLPAGLKVLDAGGGTQTSGNITWSLGALNAAQVGERRVRVRVEDMAADDPLLRITRGVISSGANAARASVVTQVQPATLALELIAEPDPLDPVGPVPGATGLLTYRVTVSNLGLTDAAQVELRMTLPVGIFGCGTASDDGTAPDGCGAGRDILWTLTRSRGNEPQRAAPHPGPGRRAARHGPRDQRPGAGCIRRARPCRARHRRPDRAARARSHDRRRIPVLVDEDLEYVLRFGNRGDDALLGTQLVLTLPADVSVVDPDGGTEAAGTITWALGTLDPGETGAHRVRVHLEKPAARRSPRTGGAGGHHQRRRRRPRQRGDRRCSPRPSACSSLPSRTRWIRWARINRPAC